MVCQDPFWIFLKKIFSTFTAPWLPYALDRVSLRVLSAISVVCPYCITTWAICQEGIFLFADFFTRCTSSPFLVSLVGTSLLTMIVYHRLYQKSTEIFREFRRITSKYFPEKIWHPFTAEAKGARYISADVHQSSSQTHSQYRVCLKNVIQHLDKGVRGNVGNVALLHDD